MADRIVRNSRGDIDVERSSLETVLHAQAGSPPRCEICGGRAKFLDPSGHKWDCPRHPRINDSSERNPEDRRVRLSAEEAAAELNQGSNCG
jgi:hypothetical protein